MANTPRNRTRVQRSDGLTPRARQLRREMTPPERRLWELLRDQRLGGFKFRRQHPVGRYIADFYCSTCGLVVELDGESHALTGKEDGLRTAYMASLGLKVIRVGNQDLLHAPDAVAKYIVQECRLRIEEPSPARQALPDDLSSP